MCVFQCLKHVVTRHLPNLRMLFIAAGHSQSIISVTDVRTAAAHKQFPGDVSFFTSRFKRVAASNAEICSWYNSFGMVETLDRSWQSQVLIFKSVHLTSPGMCWYVRHAKQARQQLATWQQTGLRVQHELLLACSIASVTPSLVA